MTDINDKAFEIIKVFASRENANAEEVLNLYKGLIEDTGSTTTTESSVKEAPAAKKASPAKVETTPQELAPAAPAEAETTTPQEPAPAAPAEEPQAAPASKAPAKAKADKVVEANPEADSTEEKSASPMQPAVPVAKSVTNEKIHCLCCGQGMRMLKRHLRMAHNMTPDQYRIEFNLPDDYPMSAPGFTAAKAEMAKRLDFGKYERQE